MKRSPYRSVFLIVFGVVSAVLVSPSASAQDASTAVYDDVKQIIEDLLTSEVSHTVSPNLACLAGHTLVPKDATPGSNDIDVTTDLSDGGKPVAGDQFVTLEAVTYFPKTLQTIYDGQFANLKPLIRAEAADLVADVAYKQLKAKTVNMAAVSASVTAAASSLEAVKARAARLHRPRAQDKSNQSGVDFAPLTDDQLDVCFDNLSIWLQNKSLVGGPSALDTDCTGKTRDEYACDLAYAVQDTMLSDPTDAEGYLVRAMAEFIAEVELKAKPSDAQLATALTIVTTMLNAPGYTQDAVAAASTSLTNNLKVAAPDALLLTELVDQWKAFRLTGSQHVSVASFTNSMGGVTTLIADGCAISPTAEACQFFDREKQVLGATADLWSVIRLAASGDDVDASQLVIDELFHGLKDKCDGASKPTVVAPPGVVVPGGCTTLPYYQRFADAVVVYAVQAHTAGTPTDEARAVLRSATVDMVQEISIGGGIQRRTFSGKGILLPDLALRYDWSPSFVNASSGAGRVVATATWLKFRIPIVHTRMGYSSATISLVDFLAPLAELAARPTANVKFNDSKYLAANWVAPRLDFEGGIPALSKNLLVGGGITYRFVVPRLTAPSTMTTRATYQYESCLSHGSAADCFEFGVFAKYVM